MGPNPCRISCATALLNKHIPEATSCLSTAGKSAAPCSFIFKLCLDEVESGIGEKTVYSGFSYFNRLPFVPSTSISHISRRGGVCRTILWPQTGLRSPSPCFHCKLAVMLENSPEQIMFQFVSAFIDHGQNNTPKPHGTS